MKYVEILFPVLVTAVVFVVIIQIAKWKCRETDLRKTNCTEGMIIGLCLGTAFGMNFSSAISCFTSIGMLVGFLIGLQIKKE